MTNDVQERRRFRISDLSMLFGKKGSLKEFGILGALVVIVVVFQIATDGATLSSGNLINVVQSYSYILILAIGMVMVIIAGHIDLSVGSVAAFVGVVVAFSMADWNWPWYASLALGVALGMVIGAWQGFWVAFVGVPAFIVTLAGMLMFRGLQQLTGVTRSPGVDPEFTAALAGFLPEWGPNTGFNNSTLVLGLVAIAAVVLLELRGRARRLRTGAEVSPAWVLITRLVLVGAVIVVATLLFASGRVGQSFPLAGVILVVFVLAYGFLTNNTTIGRHIYAVGGNRRAAELSGVRSRWTDFFVMANMSTLAAVAGMMYVARARFAGPQDGTGWELDAIAAVFIGGAAVAGGIGTVAGSIIGGLVMAVLTNGLFAIGTGADWIQIIKGIVLLIAVAIDVVNKQQGRFSIIGLLLRGMRGRSRDELSS
ncbi:multiple monosaccharide ABC transporter permease [Agrococcus jejuensis]|uniref:Xylose transport system permease protein XylH n=1 Tax=Agrococcus jejuensis TaxID=399736 RepID=A0A1G8F3W1_9MICO|nr:multiple monosaccharide ABC transporter permease [Agrococcus jejuensis]SDH76835.1 putative multiple sugar transport system permease protein [Agrococcus jejuensis]